MSGFFTFNYRRRSYFLRGFKIKTGFPDIYIKIVTMSKIKEQTKQYQNPEENLNPETENRRMTLKEICKKFSCQSVKYPERESWEPIDG